MFNQAYNAKCLILIIWSRGWVIINFTLAHVVSSLSASYLNTYQCFYFHFICVIYSFLHGFFLLFSSIKTSFPVCCRHSKISGSKRKKTSQSIQMRFRWTLFIISLLLLQKRYQIIFSYYFGYVIILVVLGCTLLQLLHKDYFIRIKFILLFNVQKERWMLS